MKVTLPNNWRPRPDQMGLWSYLENGGVRAVEVAHRRRAGAKMMFHCIGQP